MLGVIILVVLGYLLEITASEPDGGFVAIKLLYSAMMFLPVSYIVFVFEYCEAKLSRAVVWLLLICAAVISVLIWTTDTHGLIYTEIRYVTDTMIHHIETDKGIAFLSMHIFTMIIAVVTLVLLLHRLFKWKRKHRVNIILLIIGLLIPLLANLLFLVTDGEFGVNLTPALMTVVCLLFYLSIVRGNLFNILPRAKEIALESIKEAFILVDDNKNYVHANEAASELLPMLKSLKKESRLDEYHDWPFELQVDENNEIITPVGFNLPEDNHYNANISPLIDNKHKVMGYIIIIQNITESVMLTKKLEELAHTDAMTGIMNRQHFMNLASMQFEKTKRIPSESYVIMFDVDHFKSVNDTYGHLFGDEVLKSIAARVKDMIRPYDLFGRYGGEEFIMLVSDISKEDVINHADRIRLTINGSPMTYEGTELTVSASFGVAPLAAADELIGVVKLADEALYKAKRDGRDRVVMADC